MSDSSSAPQAGEDQPGGVTAGQLLMQMRQAAGMHIAALATTLKVPVERLEALEADDYDAFNDKVFMRALAASACRVLKHDPAAVLTLLPGSRPAPLRIDKGINASFKDAAPRGSFSGAAEPPRSRLLGVVVALLLVGALAIVLWPAGLSLDSLIARGSSDAPAAVQQPISGGTASGGTAEALVAAPTPAGTAAADTSTPDPATADSAAQPAVAPPPVAAAPATSASAAAPESDAVLVLRASAPSWVQVRSGGAVVLQKTLAAGESAPVPGQGPWSLVIGKADVTEVIVRGQALDLKALARDNVARFEVK